MVLFGRVICLSDLGNILVFYLDKTILLYKYKNVVCGFLSAEYLSFIYIAVFLLGPIINRGGLESY